MKQQPFPDSSIPMTALLSDALNAYNAQESFLPPECPPECPPAALGHHLANEGRIRALRQVLANRLEPIRAAHPSGLSRRDSLSPAERSEIKTVFTDFLLALDEETLLFDEPFLRFFLDQGYLDAAEVFLERTAREDPELAHAEVFQALRNVWIMNSLQLLWGLPLEVTPSVYAYSMLYPYTDNFLDDPATGLPEKVLFNEHLSKALTGQALSPVNPVEEQVFRKIRLIESQYDRGAFPRVYESIRLIQGAQAESLAQDDATILPREELLSLSFYKGGASVLADAFLVKGSLSLPEMEFAVAYGAFLQLLDDFQDARRDAKDRHQTLFSLGADATSRSREIRQLIRYIIEVNAPRPGDPEALRRMKQVISSCTLLLIRSAAGKDPSLITSALYQELEGPSKVRLSFYQELENSLSSLVPTL